MSADLSRTDEILILLNRLAATSDEEKQQLLPSTWKVSSRRTSTTRPHQQLPSTSPENFLQGLQAVLQRKLATAAELGTVLQGRATSEDPPEVSPLQVVLGEQQQRWQQSFRRSKDSFRRKLFGQPTGEADDPIEPSESSKDVRVHPLSSFRKYWEIVTIALVVYTVLVLPFRAAFYVDYYRDLEHHHSLFQQLQVDWMLSTDVFVDFFFIGDIVLNFKTGFIKEQVLIMQQGAVVRHYLRSWFLLDCVASFPIDLLFMGKRLDIWRLPRLLKIVRVLQYKTFTQLVHDMARLPVLSNISRFHMKILRLLVILLVWVHWSACLNYGSCAYQHPPRHCWVDVNGLADASIHDKYAWSMLKSLSESLTAGYGKQEPASAGDCWITILSLLVGISLWTYMASIVTTLLISMNAASSEYMVKMQEISTYMEHRHLPQALRQRIRDAYEARWKAEKHFDEEAILEELPPSLRIEVCMHTCADIIASVPFFEDAEEGFTTSLVTCLKPQVSLKGDVIVREGEVSREMYFIKSGAAQVEVGGVPITVLKSGSYFGEIGLLRDARRNATVTALSRTLDLFVLTKVYLCIDKYALADLEDLLRKVQSKEDFDEVMKTYPESFKAMDLVAEHRLRSLHKSSAWEQWQQQQAEAASQLGSKIQQILQDEELETCNMQSGGAHSGATVANPVNAEGLTLSGCTMRNI